MLVYQRVPYLVGGWPNPLKNMSSSVGMMTFPIYGKIKAMFQTTNQISCTILICEVCPTFPNKYTGYKIYIWLMNYLQIGMHIQIVDDGNDGPKEHCAQLEKHPADNPCIQQWGSWSWNPPTNSHQKSLALSFPGQLSGQHKNDFHYNPLHWQMKISLLKSRSIFQQIMTFPGRFPLVLPTFPEWPVSILDCRPPKLSPRLGSCCPRCKHWRPAKPWQREGPVPCIFPKYETRFWFNGCS